MVKAKSKKPAQHKGEKVRRGMKIVTSDICEVCKTPCPAGMEYAAHMRIPGAAGKGIPCILTKIIS